MTKPSAEHWRSLPSMALDAFVIGMGVWWLYSVAMVYTHQSFVTLRTFLFVPVLGTLALWAWLVRPPEEPVAAPPSATEPASWLPAGLMPVGFGLLCWWALGLPFLFAWVPIIVFLGLLVANAGPLTGPARAVLDRRDAISLGLAMFFCFVIVSGMHRPEIDDAYHVSAIIGTLEHSELAVLSFDTMHGDVNAPIQQLIHRPQTYEVFIAAVTAVLGCDPLTLYWIWMPALVGPLVAISVWRLMKALAPPHAWAAVWLLFAVWLAWGDDYRAYGSYTFARLSQGKPVFICLFVPAILYSTARYADRPSARSFGLLTMTLAGAATYTSSALLLAPIAAGIGLLSQMRLTIRSMAIAAAGLLTTLPLLSALVMMKLEVSGVGGLRHDGWLRDMMVVVGETPRGPIALFAVVALPMMLLLLRSPTGAWAARLVGIAFLLVYNDLTAPILAENVAELFSWRLYWIVPVPLLAAMGAVAAMDVAITSRERWRIGATGALVAVLCLGFWFAGDRAYERRFVSWQWWSHKLPVQEHGLAARIVEMTEPDDLALAPPRVAERLTGLADRPRLVSVRESYLTNLSRYWGMDEFEDRLILMEFAQAPIRPQDSDRALELIGRWCIDVVVLKRHKARARHALGNDLRIRGFENAGRTKKYITFKRTNECTPAGPPSHM